mmetsp:Transcript_39407/g.72559  ORF Transcript_39407/g.72559 Transcript_39407/m.72559 type:complete len:298 (-) Transcript_39407:414-1307(-)
MSSGRIVRRPLREAILNDSSANLLRNNSVALAMMAVASLEMFFTSGSILTVRRTRASGITISVRPISPDEAAAAPAACFSLSLSSCSVSPNESATSLNSRWYRSLSSPAAVFHGSFPASSSSFHLDPRSLAVSPIASPGCETLISSRLLVQKSMKADWFFFKRFEEGSSPTSRLTLDSPPPPPAPSLSPLSSFTSSSPPASASALASPPPTSPPSSTTTEAAAAGSASCPSSSTLAAAGSTELLAPPSTSSPASFSLSSSFSVSATSVIVSGTVSSSAISPSMRHTFDRLSNFFARF